MANRPFSIEYFKIGCNISVTVAGELVGQTVMSIPPAMFPFPHTSLQCEISKS